ncbi:MAG: hypothetical protein U1E73_03640 [Planctomycetota bacterium]
MQHLRAIPLVLVLGACASNQTAEPTPAAPVAAAPAPVAAPPAPVVAEPAAAQLPKSLKSAMKGIEDDWHVIEKALEGDPSGELPAIAAAATRCAGVMKLAYDPWEDKEVPDFAKFAHEAESALLDFAKAAGAGDAATVRELGKTLQPNHCARCHDAVEEVHG